MTHRITCSLVASLAATAVLAAPAAAIPSSETGSPDGAALPPTEVAYEYDDDYEYETVTSDPGIVCGIGDQPIESAHATSGPAMVAESGSQAYSETSEGDACSGSYRPNCKTVVVKVRQRTLLYLSIAFEWVVEKSWCWAYPKVTWWSVRTYPTQMDRYIQYRGVVGQNDSFFTWCCFSARSGHHTYRMGRFENCLPLKGCIGSWYPRVRINVHGNGTHTVQRGV